MVYKKVYVNTSCPVNRQKSDETKICVQKIRNAEEESNLLWKQGDFSEPHEQGHLLWNLGE